MDFNLSEVMNSSEILNESFELSPQQGVGGNKTTNQMFYYLCLYVYFLLIRVYINK